ncbi:MAG: hypothetical protein ACRDFS_07540 [Chloroflexota bacterium]
MVVGVGLRLDGAIAVVDGTADVTQGIGDLIEQALGGIGVAGDVAFGIGARAGQVGEAAVGVRPGFGGAGGDLQLREVVVDREVTVFNAGLEPLWVRLVTSSRSEAGTNAGLEPCGYVSTAAARPQFR